MGYQDVIRVLYGYSFDTEAIIGIRVLESKETPGLGDKIETDPDFLGQLEARSRSLAPVYDPAREEKAWRVLLAELDG